MQSSKTLGTKMYTQSFTSTQQLLPTAPFPRKHIHCVFDTWEDAMHGYRILEEAGYDTRDIHVLASGDYVEAMEQKQTLLSFFISSDLDIYQKEAQRGHHILMVHTTGYEQMKHVRNLLAPHHARLMKYIDTWTTVDLIS